MSALTITMLEEAHPPQASLVNAAYTEIETAVNAVDRTNLSTTRAITMVTSVWEDLFSRPDRQTHKIVVPEFVEDQKTYLVGFSYSGRFNGGATKDIRLRILRGDSVWGDKDIIEDMMVYRGDIPEGGKSVSGTRDTVTEAFVGGDYISIELGEQVEPAPDTYSAGIDYFEVHLFLAYPVLALTEL